MTEQIRVWPEFANSDRLVVIDAELFSGKTVGINPLDGRGMDLRARNHAAQGFAQLFGDFTGDMSVNMRILAHNCAELLMSIEGTTIGDFKALVRVPEKPKRGEEAPPPPPKVAAILERARSYPRPGLREFFATDFDNDYYKTTRNSLMGRLQTLTANMDVEAMLTGGSTTLDLAEALNGGKVVLVNLLSFGEEAVPDVGLFLLAMITAIAFRRRALPADQRVPVHLFVDEAADLGGPRMVKVVNALRKFGVHATLAQQTGGQGYEKAEMKEALFNSTAIKILASDRPHQFAKLAGLDFDALPTLGDRQFWVKWGDTKTVEVIGTDAEFAGTKRQCTAEEWAETLSRLKHRDYRDAFEKPTVSDASSPDVAPPASPPAHAPPADLSSQTPASTNQDQIRWKPRRPPLR